MPTRRNFLRFLAGTAGALVLARRGGAAAAPAKLPKATVGYQTDPHGMDMCGMCKYFIPPKGHADGGMMGGGRSNAMMQPGTCRKVAGPIDPMGWCRLYQQRAMQHR